MDFKVITLDYYSHWIGKKEILSKETPKILFLQSDERNNIQNGYSKRFDLYVWIETDRIFVSYGEKAAPKIALLQNKIKNDFSLDTIKKSILKVYENTLSHNVKFIYTGNRSFDKMARALAKTDYEAYLSFFKAVNPNCRNTDWVKYYFDEMVAMQLCCGVFDNGRLVSCMDAPMMAYMEQEVQEIGIHTLEKFRNKGYAMYAATLCAENIIRDGKFPQWSCSADNIASARLAEKIGFIKLSDVLTLTIENTSATL